MSEQMVQAAQSLPATTEVPSLEIPAKPNTGPSGSTSTRKYLENKWDKGTFGSVKKSIEYHLRKHGNGMSEVEYTKRAIKAFNDSGARRIVVTDKLGRSAVQVVSKEGTGLYSKAGKIIWFQPK